MMTTSDDVGSVKICNASRVDRTMFGKSIRVWLNRVFTTCGELEWIFDPIENANIIDKVYQMLFRNDICLV